MKKKDFIIISLCILLFLVSTGNAGEGFKVDGNDWKQWSEGSKLYFVLGWLKCGKAAWDTLPLDFNKWDEAMEFSKNTGEFYRNAGVLIGGVTIRQVIDTINIIYSDPRVNMMDITEIMPLVTGRLTQGWTLKELDEVIALMVRLDRCEKEEKARGRFTEECSSVRKERNAYLQRIRKR